MKLVKSGAISYLSLVAMDQNRMVFTIQNNIQSFGNGFIRYRCDLSFLITRHANLDMGNSVILQELSIFLRVRIRNQGSGSNISNFT